LTGDLSISHLQINEGQAFVLSDLGGAITNFGIGVSDPGFDNPANPNPADPANNITDPTHETFTNGTIDWGDGSAIENVTIQGLNSVLNTGPTTAKLQVTPHVYADDGDYHVKIVFTDDNGGQVTPSEIIIHVNNVPPTLTPPIPSATTINEAGNVSFNTSFSDPGFDNPKNPTTPATGDPLNESFRYFIDWGDGRNQESNIPVADTNGGPGVTSKGTFGGSHNYADNGTYTVTVRIADDNMTGNFAGGMVGVDFVEQKFTVTVGDLAPSFVKPNPNADFAGDAVDIHGLTQVRVSYTDVGYDNFANAANAANGGQFAETPVYLVDWGDGTIDAMHHYAVDGTYTVTVTVTPSGGSSQTYTLNNFNSSANPALTLVSSQTLQGALKAYSFVIDWGDNDGTAAKNGAHAVTSFTLMLAEPSVPVPVVNSGLTTVLSTVRTPGQGTVNLTVPTKGSSEIQHRYLGPPDPLNPSANIQIQMTVFDDDGMSTATSSIFITNPGIQTQMIFIDTTPDVARLEFAKPAAAVLFVGQQSTATDILQISGVRAAAGEMVAAADRYLELVVVYPDGTEGQRYKISDEALNDLRGFFKTLPDGRYRVYLVRTENNSRRLVIEINVRRGLMINPSDESEGTRDRPPTSEDQGQPAKPLNENPQLEAVPGGFGSNSPATPAETATAESGVPAAAAPPVELRSVDGDRWTVEDAQSADRAAKPEVELPVRRVMPLAAFGLAAAARPWSEEVDKALAEADDESWKRLRRAGRRGRPGRDDPQPRIRRLLSRSMM
jgi:hypothetical protein